MEFMDVEENRDVFERNPQAAPWVDLLLYIGVGLGLFLGAGFAVGDRLLDGTILSSALLYGLTILVFGGTVFLVGVLRGRLSLAQIGFWPPRISRRWAQAAFLVTLLFLPLRIVIGLLVEWLTKGTLQGLMESPRMDIFAPEGFSWASFLITLVLVGILVPIAEELFFRGALYTWFRRRFNMPVAVLASSALFALGHADTLVVVVTSLILGVVMALLYEYSRTLWVPILVHMVNNSLATIALYFALLSG